MTKVFELAKEKGLTTKEVLDKMKSMGLAAKTPMSVVSEEDSKKLDEALATEAEEKKYSYAYGIRRFEENGKEVSSLLTFQYDVNTLEVKLIKEERKKNYSRAILDFVLEAKMNIINGKRKK